VRAPLALSVVVLLAAAASPAWAQQLEPRAYSPAPIGTNFFGVVFANSSGDVVFDPSVPLTNVSANVNAVSPFYAHTFPLLGRTASIGASLPYAWGSARGDVGEVTHTANRSGIADVAIRFTCNIVGGPALSPRDFATRKQGAMLGSSLVVTGPTGQYDGTKLVNIGTNRWSIKPELGFSQPVGRWWFDVYAGAWFFTTNHDFFGGHTREQDPLAVVQGHVSVSLRPRMWLALDATWYAGGRTTVDGVKNADRQENSRLGLTYALPVSKTHSLKFAYAKGATRRVGSKLDTISVGWQFLWFDPPPKPR
jgi:outer membrane putative beta-barrel porin/alpha-amylase